MTTHTLTDTVQRPLLRLVPDPAPEPIFTLRRGFTFGWWRTQAGRDLIAGVLAIVAMGVVLGLTFGLGLVGGLR